MYLKRLSWGCLAMSALCAFITVFHMEPAIAGLGVSFLCAAGAFRLTAIITTHNEASVRAPEKAR